MIDLKPWRRRPIAGAVMLVSILAAALALFAGRETRLARVAAGESYALSAPVTIATSPRVVLERGKITVVSAPGASRLSTLWALVTGRRADLALDGAEITIDAVPASRRDEGVPAAFAASLDAALHATLARLDFNKLSLTNSGVMLRLANGTAERFENISADLVHAAAEVTATGKLVYRGETLAFDGAVTPPAFGSADVPVPIRAVVKGTHAALQLAGYVAAGERLEIKAPTAQLSIASVRDAARWLGEKWPEGRGLGAFTAAGSMLLDPSILSFDRAHFSLDGNEATGTLTLRLDRPRTAVQGTLAFETLSLAPYAAANPAKGKAAPADWLASIRLPGMAAHSLAREIDADLRVSAKSVVLEGTNLGHCAASLAIKDGKVLGEIAELELDQGGSGEGQLTADLAAEPPVYKLRAELRNVDVGKVVAAGFETAPFEGLGSVTLELYGAGRTEDALLTALSGKIAIELPDGGRVAFDPDAMVEAATASAAAPQERGWAKVVSGASAVDRFAAVMALDHGILRADHIEAVMGDRALSAAGTLSLVERSLDMTVSILPAGEPAATGRERLPLSAYRLLGPLSAPVISTVTRPGKAAAPKLGPANGPG